MHIDLLTKHYANQQAVSFVSILNKFLSYKEVFKVFHLENSDWDKD